MNLSLASSAQGQQNLIHQLRGALQHPTHLAATSSFAQDEFSQLIQDADRHKVLPFLCRHLLNSAIALSPEQQACLRELYNRSALHTVALTGELFRILDYLESSHIPVFAFKGVVLSVLAYGEVSLRSFADIDICVRPADFFRPKSVLEQYGYEAQLISIFSPKQEYEFFWWLGEYTMRHPETEIHIDVHGRCVAGDGFAFHTNLNRFWDRLEPIEILGRSILTLKREDFLLYLCIGGTKDGWPRLQAVCDLAAFINRQQDLDWDFILTEALDLKVDRMLRLGLLLTHHLLGQTLSPRLHAFCKVDAKASWLADRIADRLQHSKTTLNQSVGYERWLIRFVALGHWDLQMRQLLGFLTRSLKFLGSVNQLDYQFCPLPKRLYFMYYLLRPIRLINKHRFGLVKVIFR